MKRMVISPHFDDEILGVGGSISKYCNDEWKIVYVTDANNDRKLERENVLRRLTFEVPDIKIFDLKFNDSASKIYAESRDMTVARVASELSDLVKRLTPDIVYIPFSSLHQDHQLIRHASLVALRSFSGTILEYEYADQFNQFGLMSANYFETLSNSDLKLKYELMELYSSQMTLLRDSNAITSLASLRGYQANTDFAEAFNLVRLINK